MFILTLDVSTHVGWALYNTKTHISSMKTGHFYIGGGDRADMQKCSALRAEMIKLIRALETEGMKPEYAVIEAPLRVIKSFAKKKQDLAGEQTEMTMNPGTALLLNRLSGVVQTVIEGFRIPCSEVQPQSWQAVALKGIKGTTKQRSDQMCRMLRINAKNEHSRDAAGIAVWAAGHCQELKLIERTQPVLAL